MPRETAKHHRENVIPLVKLALKEAKVSNAKLFCHCNLKFL
jgi:tRNA A37 threonylcarbamoyltransferase TsaD